MEDIICWEDCHGAPLSQGEYLNECPVVLVSDISESAKASKGNRQVKFIKFLTQGEIQ